MEDILDNIVYFIILIAFMIIGAAAKKKKPPQAAQNIPKPPEYDEQKPERKPPSLFDAIKEQMGEEFSFFTNNEVKVTPEEKEPEPESEIEPEKPDEITPPVEEGIPVFQDYITSDDLGVKIEDDTSLYDDDLTKFDPHKEEKKEEKKHPLLEDFDAQKAIIIPF